ncbi:MAG: hypothetical protein K8W52_09060 [Deltaproteobacteria bacterium]|nr:hypothetical protein [Deltaproteobacteria bacterium]
MYQGFVGTTLGLSGMSPAAAKAGAADVMAVETAIAKISKDKVARRDPVGTYNRLDRQGVIAATKHFDWAGYWKGQGVPAIDAITVTSPEFLAGLDGLITTIKPAQWRAYLTFHLYVGAAPLLDKKFDDAAFAFTSVLTGQPAQPPRWKRWVRATDGALGDLLGAQFVKARFAGSAKDGALGPGDLGGDEGQPRRAAVDGREDQGRRVREAREDDLPDRLSERVEDLRVRDRRPRLREERAGRGRDRARAPARQDRQARRQGRLADDRVDGQRLLRSEPERHGVPGRHPAAAVLQPGRVGGREPRRHGHGRRPRADPRLRRSGRAVRRRRQSQDLVGERDRGQVQGQDPVRRRPVQRLRGGARREAQRRQHPGREHRRHRWRQAGVPRVPRAARRPGADRGRGLHRGPDVLPRLRPGVVRQGPPRSRQAARDRRRALAAGVARQRRALRDPGVRGGVPLQGGREAAARDDLPGLVTATVW